MGIKTFIVFDSYKNYEKDRIELYKRIKTNIKDNSDFPYTKEKRLQVTVLKMGSPVFDCIVTIYKRIKVSLRK